jgi:hypothetical protein
LGSFKAVQNPKSKVQGENKLWFSCIWNFWQDIDQNLDLRLDWKKQKVELGRVNRKNRKAH